MKKKFAIAVLDPENKAFVVYIVVLSINSSDKMYPLRKAQIAYLKADKAATKVPSKYIDFANVFLVKLATKLVEQIEINNHPIELVDD